MRAGRKGRHGCASLRDGNRAHDAYRRGAALQAKGQVGLAIDAYRTAVKLAPGHADAFHNLGVALFGCGRPSEAIEAWERYLVLRPAEAQAYVSLARALIGVGRAGDAFRHLTDGCARHPNDAGLMALSGKALLRLNQAEAALGALILAADSRPDDAELHGDLSAAFTALGQSEQAAAHALAAFRLAPSAANATTASCAMIGIGAFADALALTEGAIGAQPDCAEAHVNRAIALESLGRHPDAIAAAWDAVRVAPNRAAAWFQLATSRLACGEWTPDVWQQFEWRLHLHGKPSWIADKQRWTGEDVRGKTVLLHAEQGLGDTLQFVRYAALVAGRGARVILAVQPSLVRLLGSVRGVCEVVGIGGRLPPFDMFCPLLSLPLLFGTTLDTVPGALPYITPGSVAALGGGVRVGLVWAGNKAFADDRQRSLALADLAPLAGIEGVQFYGLQPGADTMPDLPGIIDLMPGVTDFADTAALVAGLDLVIAVDTAVAHLAAAMGKPVWMLSRFRGCWRWLHGRADTPWYPTLRIHRQTRPRDWSGPMKQIRTDLAALAAAVG